MRGGTRSKWSIISTISVLLAGLVSLVIIPGDSSGYLPHQPIRIDGNGEFTVANGVTGGMGTPLDPFIIEGWEINASSKTGIEIRNTDVHFVVRDVLVHSGANGSLMTHDGVYFYNVANGEITDSAFVHNRNGVCFYYANESVLLNNHMSANKQIGIFSTFSRDISFIGNNVTSNLEKGLLLSGNDNALVAYNNVSNNEHGIEISASSNVVVQLNTIWNNTDGVIITGSYRPAVGTNNVFGNEDGILLSSSDYAEIANNSISLNNQTGLFLYSSSDAKVSRNAINDNGFFGLYLYSMVDSLLELNDVSTNSFCGMLIKFSNNTQFASNNISGNNDYGVCFDTSGFSTVIGNTIDSNADDGIILTGSQHFNLTGNDVMYNGGNGVYLNSSHGDSVSSNKIQYNGWSGILSRSSSHWFIFDNNLSHNDFGITLVTSNLIWVYQNSVCSNRFVGFSLNGSSDSYVVHNNIIGNTQQGYDNPGSNYWDDGYPSGGNYWSDYTGIDVMSGPNQDIPGSDFIGDTPYVIDADSEDRYPFTIPYEGDLFPPVVNITSPLEGEIFTAEPITVTGTAQDIGGGDVDYVLVRNLPTDWSPAIGTTSWTTTMNLFLGLNTIEARALDIAGNPSLIDTVTVTYNPPGNDPPVANFTVTPQSGYVTDTYVVDASASYDMEDSTDLLETRWDWEDDGTWDTSWSTDKTEQHQYSSPGTYMIRLDLRDTGGLTNNTSRQVEVLTSPPPPPPPANQRPDCNILIPESGDTLKGTIMVLGDASDPDGSVNRVEVRIDSGDWITANGRISWSLEWDTRTVENGEHEIYARSYDGEDFSGIDKVTITVDNAETGGPDIGAFWIFIAIAILIVTALFLILLFMLLRKKKEEDVEEELPLETRSEEEAEVEAKD